VVFYEYFTTVSDFLLLHFEVPPRSRLRLVGTVRGMKCAFFILFAAEAYQPTVFRRFGFYDIKIIF
jgi:hypothetical protein